ncbi:MAG TPA: radical SAM protein, partial [Moraxellaceae bacterium]|nr:radical SAM protein [Moraxellaceae bacterium]
MDSLRYHATVLSNLARAYDRYARVYDKVRIAESTYPDEFYLLPREQLGIGLEKAGRLAARTGLAGERTVVLETHVAPERLRPNTRNGRGEILEASHIEVAGVLLPEADGTLRAVSIEEAMALAFQVFAPRLQAWTDLKPRSFSILPVARGCQAACSFCFSRASISEEQQQETLTLMQIRRGLLEAKAKGAERAVITGGGEPGLLKFERLLEMIAACHQVLSKVTLITNGHTLGSLLEAERRAGLQALQQAGLGTLSVSRH